MMKRQRTRSKTQKWNNVASFVFGVSLWRNCLANVKLQCCCFFHGGHLPRFWGRGTTFLAPLPLPTLLSHHHHHGNSDNSDNSNEDSGGGGGGNYFPGNIEDWDSNDVQRWLVQQGFAQYVPGFASDGLDGVDGDRLIYLGTPDQLDHIEWQLSLLGVSNVDHQRELSNAIEKLVWADGFVLEQELPPSSSSPGGSPDEIIMMETEKGILNSKSSNQSRSMVIEETNYDESIENKGKNCDMDSSIQIHDYQI